jgi:alkylation response protein AidB-like acyl-CoA dehydrogenase
LISELESWLHATWDPRGTLREWWRQLASAGWATPAWPAEWHGRGLSLADAAEVHRAIIAAGAVPGPGFIGVNLLGPTLCAHGTDQQRADHLGPTAAGERSWCQLFSEPAAGSDLAGLQATAVREGAGWVVNGQKVWTSGGQLADWGMLLARTDRSAGKHAGISYFLIDMHQPGVDVRPLREMTGRAYFTEVFLTDARVRHADLVGGVGEGWNVAKTTLSVERNYAGAEAPLSAAKAGSVAGDLDRRVADFAGTVDSSETSGSRFPVLAQLFHDIGACSETLRDQLVRFYSMERIAELTAQRAKREAAAGRTIAGAPNLSKMAQNHAVRMERDLILDLLGPKTSIFDYGLPGGSHADLGQRLPFQDLVERALFAQGPPIYGGSDQIQRNIVGEQVLGLPREPRPAPIE